MSELRCDQGSALDRPEARGQYGARSSSRVTVTSQTRDSVAPVCLTSLTLPQTEPSRERLAQVWGFFIP
ncbi:hypothetical protein RRG08_016504 [Elysia crispata]|uniref:Uncharacterized protein n=1 Tax=Elysia crispata TaxID=231223 RepID=A0AAE0Y8V6_9GAST|nr:hypothetical protein RRG08_016504 [Elysia crispata]